MCLSQMFLFCFILNFQSGETPNMKPAENLLNNWKHEIFTHDGRYACKKQRD